MSSLKLQYVIILVCFDFFLHEHCYEGYMHNKYTEQNLNNTRVQHETKDLDFSDQQEFNNITNMKQTDVLQPPTNYSKSHVKRHKISNLYLENIELHIQNTSIELK